MFENIKDGDLITLKLASGEEVVCTLKSHNDNSMSIENGLVLIAIAYVWLVIMFILDSEVSSF